MQSRTGGPGRTRDREVFDDKREELDERVVDINRVSKVVKGGRRFAFRVVVVVGDHRGSVGIGVGKSRTVVDAIRKGSERARRNMEDVILDGTTIPFMVVARWAGAKVLLKPASPGTGVVAGGAVRAVIEAVGVKDILTKSMGSSNRLNVILATLHGLRQMQSAEETARRRNKPIEDVTPFWRRKRGNQ